METITVQRFAAFSEGEEGGNPAGVVVAEHMPTADDMQRIARDVGYSETVFAAPVGEGWRVRYFAPEVEVAFCGHATIALGAALTRAHGDGRFPLMLNDGAIEVSGETTDKGLSVALKSPSTTSRPAKAEMLASALALFGMDHRDLDLALPPAIANAGNDHLILGLSERGALAAMEYDLDDGAAFMKAHGLTTINLVHAQTPQQFHSRNAFAIGGVLEDPATGAAAAALAGYLRDLSWPHLGQIEILQGVDMGAPSRLLVEIPAELGSPVYVSGDVREL
ncbi:PhzF family phenazine biosynthesis protein [uncultured Pelagimonas sp.]|uniref:PhzF family phenazine biosynthesis protein n=1 Tax=uncultured Pelagimonas sp. TaxID=1618102 RepID=UPI00263164F0|nr:PhzF family phenazine biosynthesis protein [uncultured Pelagimonas sp.]